MPVSGKPIVQHGPKMNKKEPKQPGNPNTPHQVDHTQEESEHDRRSGRLRSPRGFKGRLQEKQAILWEFPISRHTLSYGKGPHATPGLVSCTSKGQIWRAHDAGPFYHYQGHSLSGGTKHGAISASQLDKPPPQKQKKKWHRHRPPPPSPAWQRRAVEAPSKAPWLREPRNLKRICPTL